MEESPLTPVLAFLKSHLLIFLLAGSGLVLIGYGLIQYLTSSSQTVLPSGDTTSGANQQIKPVSDRTEPTLSLMTVDVEGAVTKPGVYQLPEKSRIQDAVLKAGGFSTAADTDMIAKTLNMAALLQDGTKIYIPKIGDVVSNVDASSGSSTVLSASTGVININTATSSDLDGLIGIGQVTAQKIISGRPYTQVQDLLTKKIVTQKEFDKIKDSITTY